MNAGINLARFPSLGAILSLPPGGWSGTDVPLAQRGVRTSWLVRFVRDVMDDINRPRSEAIVQAGRAVNHNKPGRRGLHDQLDMEIPAIPKYTLLNVRSLVEQFVLALTVELRAPLWALRAGKAARRSHLTDMEAVVAGLVRWYFLRLRYQYQAGSGACGSFCATTV